MLVNAFSKRCNKRFVDVVDAFVVVVDVDVVIDVGVVDVVVDGPAHCFT